VALGAADTFSYSVNGRPSTRSQDPELKDTLYNAKLDGKRVMHVVLSPFDPDYWFALFGDGTYEYRLPKNWTKEIAPYLKSTFSLISATGKTAPKALLPPVAPATPVRRLQNGSSEYKKIQDLFLGGWEHPRKQEPYIARVYAIDLSPSMLARYNSYWSRIAQKNGGHRVNERILFHGTPRTCCLGDPNYMLQTCDGATCNLCSIIRTSFRVSRAATASGRNFMRFGRGIYTTSVSSKADDYNTTHDNSAYKAMLVAKVTLGISYSLWKTSTTLVTPPGNCDSVIGEVGEDLNYDEQVVYNDDAIRPAYLVIYEP